MPAQKEGTEELEAGIGGTCGDESGSATPGKIQTLVIEPSGSVAPASRKGTGPRTEPGKQRASHNATKHGVFSKVVLLKGESRAEYDGLLTGLWEALQPEGAAEELLVEKLSTIAWRQRRLLLAENAEIRKHTEFVESDQRDREQEEAESIAKRMDIFNNDGLIRKTQNPDVLERCLELLAELREQVEKDGFNLEYDKVILEKIYGDRDKKRLQEDFYDSYLVWMATSEVSEEERVREGYAPAEQCRKNILQEIDEETRCLKRNQKVRTSVQAARTQLEIVSRNVPDAPTLDRLLRYETSLERNFDRTLSQLERLQRIRKGQPVLPELKVRHSLS
jgi:hypothetical protein